MSTLFDNDLYATYINTVERIKRNNERLPYKMQKPIPTFEEFRENFASALSDYVVAMIGSRNSPQRQYAAAKLN